MHSPLNVAFIVSFPYEWCHYPSLTGFQSPLESSKGGPAAFSMLYDLEKA